MKARHGNPYTNNPQRKKILTDSQLRMSDLFSRCYGRNKDSWMRPTFIDEMLRQLFGEMQDIEDMTDHQCDIAMAAYDEMREGLDTVWNRVKRVKEKMDEE